MTPISSRIIEILKAHRGEPVEIADLMASAYGDREDGGPLSAEDVIRSTVYTLFSCQGWKPNGQDRRRAWFTTARPDSRKTGHHDAAYPRKTGGSCENRA